jgi:IS1 family transposase
MNKLSTRERVSVIAALVEGASINSTVRMTGVSKPTILKLIVELGAACWDMHCERVRDLPCERVQCDELWAFCYAKAKNVPEEKRGQIGVGDVWTWTAIDADSKLMISWLIGERTGYAANQFMHDVADRIANRVQLSSDGHHTYLNAVANAFGSDEIDYAQLHKIYGTTHAGAGRYSPPECIGVKTIRCLGNPDPKHISTSFIERSNLTVRMGVRRYTRLTNGFSKKVENHTAMTTIFFTYYNWCRVHATTGKTPAQASGLIDRKWLIEDMIALLDD